MLLGMKSKDTLQVVVDYSSRKTIRKRKINKLLNIRLNIDDEFSPRKSISSRYSTKNINNNFYQKVEIKKPTF